MCCQVAQGYGITKKPADESAEALPHHHRLPKRTIGVCMDLKY